jgi:hypothetical protein
VDTLAVRSDQRRRGIGRSLLEAVHGWARERRLGHVSLNVWEFNQSALVITIRRSRRWSVLPGSGRRVSRSGGSVRRCCGRPSAPHTRQFRCFVLCGVVGGFQVLLGF